MAQAEKGQGLRRPEEETAGRELVEAGAEEIEEIEVPKQSLGAKGVPKQELRNEGNKDLQVERIYGKGYNFWRLTTGI